MGSCYLKSGLRKISFGRKKNLNISQVTSTNNLNKSTTQIDKMTCHDFELVKQNVTQNLLDAPEEENPESKKKIS